MVIIMIYIGKLIMTNQFNFVEALKGKEVGNLINVPYSFNKNADPKNRVFRDTIINDAFIVNIAPGEPSFSLTAGTTDTGELSETLKKTLDDSKDGKSFVDFMLKNVNELTDLRYYTFEYRWAAYMSYVQKMSHYLWSRMGLDPSMFQTFQAAELINMYSKDKGWKSLISGDSPDGSLAFFADYRGSTISESGTNNFKASMLEESVKTGSDYLKEARFLLGSNSNAVKDLNVKTAEGGILNKASELFTGVVDTVIKGVGMQHLGNVPGSILAGTQHIFPQVWSDSDFGRSYDIGMRFHSPYGTPMEIFKRVYFPLICVMALSLPRQMGATDYGPPFLVRVDSPGLFRINCGVITQITVKRGGDDNLWTVDGLPMQVDVNISIHDMYQALMISAQDGELSLNVGLLDYLDNMAGIGITKTDLAQSVSYFISKKLNIYGNTKNRLKKAILDFRSNTTNTWKTTLRRYLGA